MTQIHCAYFHGHTFTIGAAPPPFCTKNMLKGLTINFVFSDAFCLFVFPVHVFFVCLYSLCMCLFSSSAAFPYPSQPSLSVLFFVLFYISFGCSPLFSSFSYGFHAKLDTTCFYLLLFSPPVSRSLFLCYCHFISPILPHPYYPVFCCCCCCFFTL